MHQLSLYLIQKKTDKDSLKNIEEYADVAAKSIKESTPSSQ